MYKVAILGCENSHADVFIDLVQNKKLVTDVEFVGVYSDEPDAVARIWKKYGVPSVERYDAFVGRIDGLIITARHGDHHFKYAKPYIESGIPMFIDKPITNSEEEAVAFMKALKANNIRFCGGSCCVHADYVKELAEAVKNETYGKVMSGHLRAPMDFHSEYGGFLFYAQHLVQVLCAIFGNDPLSVRAFQKDESILCVVRYKKYDIILEYAEKRHKVYYAAISCQDHYIGDTYSVKETFAAEFMEFYQLLRGGDSPCTYAEFIHPVFIMNAIVRSLENGTEEIIRQMEEL